MLPKSVRRFLLAAILAAGAYYFVLQPRHRHSGSRENFPSETPRRDSREHRSERHSERAAGDRRPNTSSGDVICETKYFADWTEPAADSCSVHMRNGYPMPDPRCTPGGVNPSITADVLRDSAWRTRTVRNCASSEAQKHVAYR